MATERKLIFKFSGSSCRPAYPGFWREEEVLMVTTVQKPKNQQSLI